MKIIDFEVNLIAKHTGIMGRKFLRLFFNFDVFFDPETNDKACFAWCAIASVKQQQYLYRDPKVFKIHIL